MSSRRSALRRCVRAGLLSVLWLALILIFAAWIFSYTSPCGWGYYQGHHGVTTEEAAAPSYVEPIDHLGDFLLYRGEIRAVWGERPPRDEDVPTYDHESSFYWCSTDNPDLWWVLSLWGGEHHLPSIVEKWLGLRVVTRIGGCRRYGIYFPLKLLAIPWAVFALWCTIVAWRRRRTVRAREFQSLCQTCGYDLRATPTRCPECGTHVS